MNANAPKDLFVTVGEYDVAFADMVNLFDRNPAHRITPEQAGLWRAAGVHSASAVSCWLRLGMPTPEQRPEGLSLDDVFLLRALDVEYSPGWSGIGGGCDRAAARLVRAGKEPVATLAVLRALEGADATRIGAASAQGSARPVFCQAEDTQCGYTVEMGDAACRILEEAPDLDWADLALCLRAEMGLDEAMTHLRAGRGMAQVRVLAGLGQ